MLTLLCRARQGATGRELAWAALKLTKVAASGESAPVANSPGRPVADSPEAVFLSSKAAQARSRPVADSPEAVF